jgi:uncharacterized membrane protein
LFLVAAAVLFVAYRFEWQSYYKIVFAGQDWESIFDKRMLCIVTIFGILLTAVGLFYASVLIRVAGILTAAASVLGLVLILGDSGIYHPLWNSIFGTWLTVGAGVGVGHLLYRYWKEQRGADYDFWSERLFIIAAGVIIAGCCIEWHRYWSHQELADSVVGSLTLRGALYSVSVFSLILLIRPLSPGGAFIRIISICAAGIAGLIAVFGVYVLYYRVFGFLLNTIFPAQAAPVAAVFIAAILLRKDNAVNPKWYQGLALFGVILLWGILSEQVYLYWSCLNEYGSGLIDWKFKANLSLSLLWAGYGTILLIVGFWKQMAVIRYLALGLFGLLLVKVFLVDMSTVKSVYRIAAFLATGLTLVGVSYLYQFLKKQGFFDRLMAGQQQEKG